MQRRIDTGKIGDSMSAMRVTCLEQIAWIQNSLEGEGQLHPVVVRKKGAVYHMLDRFNRYYTCRILRWDKLQAHMAGVDDITAKSMILSYNQQGSWLLDCEEAQIVYSLKREHLMKQEEFATLLSKSYS